MKIVISATGKDTESNIDLTFHRCPFFLIIDTETNSLKTIVNTTRERPTEIGATVGQIVANEGIDTVIATNIGPRAFEIFQQYGIKIYQAKGKVNEAIQQLEKGKLSEITKATI
ncbi:MAG: NifB/NifX family molybdenum-iron cluster-binding protein [Thermoplasmatales archaeon]|nr:MAG: NifB/NifX family molybdenum-iron cluster-binding protein [Thermoplasmatales archaeon]